MKTHIAIILGCILWVPSLSDGAAIWTGGAGTDTSWTNAANWSSQAVPTVEPVVFATAGASAYLPSDARVQRVDFIAAGAFAIDSSWACLAVDESLNVLSPAVFSISSGLKNTGQLTVDTCQGGRLSLTGAYWQYAGMQLVKTGPGRLDMAMPFGPTFEILTIDGGVLAELSTTGLSAGVLQIGPAASAEMGTLRVGADAVPDSVIAGSCGSALTKAGGSTLRIEGAGQLRGSLTVLGGIVQLDALNPGTNDRIADSSIVTLAGTLRLGGQAGANASEQVAVLLCRGLAKVELAPSTGGSIDLTSPVLRSVDGGMLCVAGLGTTGSGTGRVWTSESAGQLLPFATAGEEFLEVDAVGALAPLGGQRSAQTAAAPAGADVLACSPQQALASDKSIRSLKMAGPHELDLGGHDLVIGTDNGGGIVQTGLSGAGSITHGTVAATAGQWLYVWTFADMEIGADVQSRLAKAGPSKLTLSGASPAWIAFHEGTLDYASSSQSTIYGSTAGSGDLIHRGGGRLTLSGTYRFGSAGAVRLLEGELLAGGASLPSTQVIVEPQGKLIIEREDVTARICLAGGSMRLLNGPALAATDMRIDVPQGATGTVDIAMTAGAYKNRTINELSGSGTLRKVGIGTGLAFSARTGAGSFAGCIEVEQGWIKVAGSSHLPQGLKGFQLGAAGRLQLAANMTLEAMTFSGNGTIVNDISEAGSGALTLMAAGCAVRPAGILKVAGGLSAARATDGSPCVLHVDVTGGGSVAGVDYDQLWVTGNVTGLEHLELDVNISTGLDLAGDSLLVLKTPSNLTGLALANVSLSGGLIADAVLQSGGIYLRNFRSSARTGDANADSRVDDDDLSLLLSNWKAGDVGWAKGDFNDSGDVDDDDLSLLLSNWSGSGGGTIPEPAAMTLLILGCLGLVGRRRRG